MSGVGGVNLIDWLANELSVSREQAEGGAGLLLCYAKSELGRADFERVADSIPAISDIIGKAPRVELRRRNGLLVFLSLLCGGLGGLAALREAFASLGLEKAMIPRFVDSLVTYFEQQGGPEVRVILQNVLC